MSSPYRPLFSGLQERAAGILLHPTSLPGSQGIGKLGRSARRFIDFLEAAGMRHWQMCPYGPTGYGDSPYQCFSAFAGNPYLIDIEPLAACGLVTPEELHTLARLRRDRVDYGALYERFWPILRAASRRYFDNPSILQGYGDYADFKQRHADWLVPYAAFSALKDHFNGKPWFEWPDEYRSWPQYQSKKCPAAIAESQEATCFLQFLFFEQWAQLRAYAASKDVRLIGDVPIFVALDSADVWTHPEFLQLKKNGRPRAVAGVPPDYFSATGQLWGNPLYDWDRLKADGYSWWLRRLGANFQLYDSVRLDHFRGFADYWSIPADAPDARPGKWVPGPGLDFFETVFAKLGDVHIIAEDLGEITPDVIELIEATGLPGMAVLQFAFGGDAANIHLPHQHRPNQAVYPGSHDNDTTLGWYQSAGAAAQDHFRRYLGVDGSVPQWDLLRAAYKSPARLAIIPMQDLLNLGSEARMNFPGKAQGNWQWRFQEDALDTLWRESAGYLKQLSELYGRLSQAPASDEGGR